MVGRDLTREMFVALDAAYAAGDAIMDVRNSGDLDIETKTGETGLETPVGRADRAANLVLSNRLINAFPRYGLLSEEEFGDGSLFSDEVLRAAEEYMSRPVSWVIDPLDGTANFASGSDHFGVHVGLIANGKSILGVNYFPATGELFYASDDTSQSRVRNGRHGVSEVNCVSSIRELGLGHILYGGKSSFSEGLWGAIEADVFGSSESMGSSGYKASKIAQGYGTLFMVDRTRLSLWDTCSSEPIVRYAGGKITDLSGKEIDYLQNNSNYLQNGLVVSNGFVHEHALEEIAKFSDSE